MKYLHHLNCSWFSPRFHLDQNHWRFKHKLKMWWFSSVLWISGSVLAGTHLSYSSFQLKVPALWTPWTSVKAICEIGERYNLPAEPYWSVVVALSLRSEDTSRVDLSSPKETSRDHLVFFSLSSSGQGVGDRNGSHISLFWCLHVYKQMPCWYSWLWGQMLFCLNRFSIDLTPVKVGRWRRWIKRHLSTTF